MESMCVLCRKSVNYSHCEQTDNTLNIHLRSMLDFLHINSAILPHNSLACSECIQSIKSVFTFKQNCALMEKFLPATSLKGSNGSNDFEQLEKEKLSDDGYHICRLCSETLNQDAAVPLTQVLRDEDIKAVFQEYIPEMNLEVMQNLVICDICQKRLKKFKNLCFLFTYIDASKEEKVNTGPVDVKFERDMVCDSPNFVRDVIEKDIAVCDESVADLKAVKREPKEDILEETDIERKVVKNESWSQQVIELTQLKQEEIHIKCEEADLDGQSSDCVEQKKVCSRKKLNAKSYKCRECTYVSKYSSCVKRHELMHRDKSEVQMYKCGHCTYETKIRGDLKKHTLVHKNNSEVRMYGCEKCSYQSKYKWQINRHLLVHKDRLEAHMYTCGECPFETKYKGILKRHIFNHRDNSEVQMYKYKHSLSEHMILHKDESEVQMYKCGQCVYETKYKGNLSKHVIVHKDQSEVQMYKCGQCAFETKYKDYINKHMIVHKDKSEVRTYKCANCMYETKYRRHLKRHMKVHGTI